MCDTPTKKATRGQNIKFSFYSDTEARQPREIVADKSQTLYAAICQVLPYFCAVSYIFHGDVKEHHDQVVVHPLLLCGWLKDGGSVVARKRKGSNNLLANDPKDISTTIDEQTIFFVKMDDRYKKRAITTSRYTVYDGKDICVTAKASDSLLNALKEDGRFLDLEKWEMYYKQIRTSPSLEAKAKDFHNEVFTVSIHSRKRMTGLEKKPVNHRHKKIRAPILADSPVPSIKDCLTPEILKHMVDHVKSNAYSTLLKPNQQGDNADKVIRTVARKFAKKIPNARPARLLLSLSRHMQSVGYLVCGNVQATCFLIYTQIIMTSFHVFLSINDGRKKSTDPRIWGKIKVFFDYFDPGQSECMGEEEVDESQFPDIYNAKHLDYVCFRLKKSRSLMERIPLGEYVRDQALPDVEGLVTIIGHPFGREKLEETCAVVPHYTWRDELLKRVEKNRPASTPEFVHMVNAEIISEKYQQTIPYDTSLFQGSSGSPVFNMNGHIIAVHTQGYTLDENGKTIGIMEFGVCFHGIYEDIVKVHGSATAAKLFPLFKLLNHTSLDELMEED